MQKKYVRALKKLTYDWSLTELQYFKNTSLTDNISYQDSLYLNLIASKPNKYTPSKIADLLGITRPSVTHRINELEKNGYVTKTQSTTDKRIFYLNISEDCNLYYNEFEKVDLEVANKFIEKYGSENLNQLCEWLDFMSEAYSQLESKE